MASGLLRPAEGRVVVARHGGKEKIKRVQAMNGDWVYLVGDNLAESTDSRHFGAVHRNAVVAVVFLKK